jgi:A-kinase anchor protein 1
MWCAQYLFSFSVGSICVAPAMGGWYRAQVVAVGEETEACEMKFVDYGGYSTMNSSVLRQIRGDFMTLPFQAVECYLANVMPFGGTKYLLVPAVNNTGMNRCRICSEV